VKSNPNEFVPADLTIVAGRSVTWIWQSGAHTVTSDDDLFDSGIHAPPYTFKRSFPVPGDYWYYCLLHGSPGGIGHAGVIRVDLKRDEVDDVDLAPHEP
jgi:plastocyanin